MGTSAAHARGGSIAAGWPLIVPLAALVLLAIALLTQPGTLLLMLGAAALCGAVVSAMHHAEVIAHRVGEPLGTLTLAVSVSTIETALIVSMMLADSESNAVIARDAIYAAVMITCNGVVGVCLLVGGLKHREQSFRIEGASAGLAALGVLCALVLVLPALAVTEPGRFVTSQLLFVALASLLLWLVFVFIQTVRHREYFVPQHARDVNEESATATSKRRALLSSAMLVLALVAVVGLAKILSPSIEGLVTRFDAPIALVGVVIAMIVLLPEAGAASQAAHANRFQESLNLVIGSGLACIGLTVPVVVVTAVTFDLPLLLGLDPMQIALLALTFIVSAFTLYLGRTNIMLGAIHLILFAAFLFFTVVP